MRRVLARLLGMRARALTLAEDEDIARAEAERRRWGSVDPVKKQETLRGFRFRTNADKRGGNVLGDGRALVFDAQGRLLLLDHSGRGVVAEATSDPLRDLMEPGESYQGPVVRWFRVDEALPVPRNLEYTGVLFPPPALRRRKVVLSRYSSLAVFPSNDLVASASNGVIDQLRPDGTIARLAQLTGAGAVVAADANVLYALDYLGGRIARVRADGAVEPFVEGLTRPVALAVLGEAVIVAEDTGRLLRIAFPPGTTP